jgi:predicted dehydrogenase
MSERRLGIGLIGAGHIGGFHSRSLRGVLRRGLAEGEYLGVCDRDGERAEAFATAADLPLCTTEPQRLIDDPRISVVYVCTPTAEHRDLVLAAAAAGKAIFCEKPLATTLADVRRMTEAVQAAGVTNQVGLVLRHAPIFNVLKQLLDDPRLGRPMTVIFRDDQFFPIQGRYQSTWRKDFAAAGGGTLIEHSIHDLDLLRWLFGDVRRLRAQTRNLAGHDRIEDLAIVELEHESGCLATLTSVWHNVLSRPSLRQIEIFFENGYFALDQDHLGPIRSTTLDGGSRELSGDEVMQRYLSQVGMASEDEGIANRWSFEDLFFLRAVATGRPAYPDFAIALRAHELVDAAYRSAAEDGRTIPLGPTDP